MGSRSRGASASAVRGTFAPAARSASASTARGAHSSAARGQQRPQRGRPSGAAATYVRACARCNCKPTPDVAADLASHGALVIDLRLCTAESLAAICALLREAPTGIAQVVLRDGLTLLGSNTAYRERVAAHQRRPQTGALASASLRLLVAALTTFLTVRGAKLAVLDLAGAPMGQEINSLLSPLCRTLRDCRPRELRWLGLSGCRIGDAGLSLMLPLLAGRDTPLVSLEALTLAWNHLADVRLLTTLLRARARMCFERRAAPLQLLDLSGNPRLGDSVPSAASARSTSSARTRARKSVPRPSACQRPKGRRGALVRAATCAIAEGLPLRVLRLRRMGLDDDAMQPFLELMQTETQRCLASDGALAGASGFCMEQLDLEGNDLDPELLVAVEEGLQLLRSLREGLWERQSQQQVPAERRAREEAPQVIEQQVHRRPWRRARSEPGIRCTSTVQESILNDVLARDAMSDGESCLQDKSLDGGESLQGDVQGKNPSRESFLLQRVSDKRRFHQDAAELSKRQLPNQQNRGRDGLDSWAEAQLEIAGVLGPAAAQSVVRQAILQELYAEMVATDGPGSGEATAHASEGTAEITLRRRSAKDLFVGTSSSSSSSRDEAQAEPCGRSGLRNLQQYLPPDRAKYVHGVPARARSSSIASASSSDVEVEQAQTLRDCRLDQLREAVIGALTGPIGAQSSNAAPSSDGDRPFLFNHGDLENKAFDTMHREALRDPAVSHNCMSMAGSKDGLLDMKLDDMHREALRDLSQQNRISSHSCG